MEQIHNRLLKNSKTYASWHRHPLHAHIHWATLFLFCFFVANVFLINISVWYPSTLEAADSNWPDSYAYWSIRPTKTSGMEMTDARWAHLHHNEPAAQSVGFSVSIRRSTVSEVTFDQPSQHQASQLKIRYVAEGRNVDGTTLRAVLSPWLNSPYLFTISSNAPEIASWPSGIYSLTVEVQTKETSSFGLEIDPVRKDFAPYPMFLHLGGRATRTTWVPVLHQNDQEVSQPQMWFLGIRLPLTKPTFIKR